MVEALAAGASMSISLVANIAVNLIAFVAILAFVDGILMWLGSMVGVPNLSFDVSFSCCHFHAISNFYRSILYPDNWQLVINAKINWGK